ncbi:MAG: AlpA family transcriptional regulator [Pseudomonadota bacterium]
MNIIRLEKVIDKTGLGRSSIYKLMAEGTFPNSVPLTSKAVGWVSDEVDAWVLARIGERDQNARHEGKFLRQ